VAGNTVTGFRNHVLFIVQFSVFINNLIGNIDSTSECFIIYKGELTVPTVS
jgi:hypothetical protein